MKDVIAKTGGVMDGSQAPITETDVTGLAESGEGVVAILGREFLTANASLEALGKGLLVLTDNEIYQAGMRLLPKGEIGFKKAKGANRFPLAGLRGVEIIEQPIPRWIGLLGWFLTLGGMAIMIAAFIHGGGFVIAIALFTGPVWMCVPGIHLIVHSRTGTHSFLKFTFADHEFAVACREYPDEEVAEFEQRCAEKLEH